MDFDPLELFTPTASSFDSISPFYEDLEAPSTDSGRLNLNHVSSTQESDVNVQYSTEESEEDVIFVPIHIHDLPLLRCLPPFQVLVSFLRLLSPETSLNFAPSGHSSTDDAKSRDHHVVFAEKNVSFDLDSLEWLLRFCPRFSTLPALAAVPSLADSFKKAFTSQYNGWLTQLISCSFQWIEEEEAAQIQSLAALRLAENCGRTAQPEMMRSIEIPHLDKKLMLKEPSLTADNLGLKTWGSSFILGSRLARQTEKNYLVDPVLELGAGTGLVGMVACSIGFPTMLTDLNEIVPNLQANVDLNAITNAQVAELDWSNPESFLVKYGSPEYSTIILSDPLYSSQHPRWIVNMINLFLSRKKESRVLLQIPVRRSFEEERACLWRLMEENGYTVEEECIEQGFDDFGESSFIFKKYIRA